MNTPTAASLGHTPESYTKMVNRQAASLYDHFIETLRSLREVTEPRSREMFFDELKECLSEANDLHNTGILTGHAETKVKIMLQRTFDEHKALLRQNASTFISSR